MRIRLAQVEDLQAVKAIADRHKRVFGFLYSSMFLEAILQERLFVAEMDGQVVGFVHFRCCRDGHATIYEIAVDEGFKGKGIGRALVEAVIQRAKDFGCLSLRLKCPADLPANRFYEKLGFTRLGMERQGKRPLNIWEKLLVPVITKPPQEDERGICFYVGLTIARWRIQLLVNTFIAAYDGKPPMSPFSHVIISPLIAPPTATALIAEWRLGTSTNAALKAMPLLSVMFDSGGYQVQTGKFSFTTLCERLLSVYREYNWSDWYVLPDNPPLSSDSDDEVERKVKETLEAGERFLAELPWLRERAVGVVHGRTIKQILWALNTWHKLGVSYVAFGSFPTCGKDSSVNLLSEESLRLLRIIQAEAAEKGLKLHLFGVGSPMPLLRLSEAGIKPTSVDSNNWSKAAVYGHVLFPNSAQVRFASPSQLHHAKREIADLQTRTKHICPFCRNIDKLLSDKWIRQLHNLVVCYETATKIYKSTTNLPSLFADF